MSFCDLGLLHSSYRWIDVRRLEWADRFGERVWQNQPQLHATLSRSSLGSQKALLIESTAKLVAAADDERAFTQACGEVAVACQELGWGVDALTQLELPLLESMAGLFGMEWNESLEECWSLAFRHFIESMVQNQVSPARGDAGEEHVANHGISEEQPLEEPASAVA
jgi:hypothetical protein